MRLPGLGPKTARRIWQELGITTLEELREAAAAKRLRVLPGLGPKSENILRALEAKPARTSPHSSATRYRPCGRSRKLREHPLVDRVSEAGSARRAAQTVRDLDLIATSPIPLLSWSTSPV